MKKRRLLKIFAVVVLVLLLLVTGAGIIVTRPAFIKSVVIPRVEESVGVAIDVEHISFSLFSEIELGNVRVGPAENPILQADTVLCRYSLPPFFNKTIKVNEITVKDADAAVIQHADGTWNFPVAGDADSGTTQPEQKPAEEKQQSFFAQYQLDVGSIDLQNISIAVTRQKTSGAPASEYVLKDFSLSAENIGSGKRLKANLEGVIRAQASSAVNLKSAKLKGNLTASLNSRLSPKQAALKTSLNSLQGSLEGIDIRDYQAAVEVDVENLPAGLTVNKLAAKITEADRKLMTLNLNKPLTISPHASAAKHTPGKLNLKINNLKLRPWLPLLEVFGAELPLKINKGTLSSELAAIVKKTGQQIEINGNTELDESAYTYEGNTIGGLNVKNQLHAQVQDFNKITVQDTETTVYHAGKRVFALVCNTAELTLPELTGEVTYNIAEVNEGILDAIPLEQASQAYIQQFRAQAQGHLQFESLAEKSIGDLVKDLDINMDFKVDNLLYKELEITECSGQTSLKDGKASLLNTELLVNNSPLNLDAQAILTAEPPTYRTKLSLKKLNVKPVATSFLPELAGIKGELSYFYLEAQSAGETTPDILRALQMTTSANAENVEITLTQEQINSLPVLNIIAVPLRLLNSLSAGGILNKLSPELRNLADKAAAVLQGRRPAKFSKAIIDLQVENGKTQIKECRFLGDPIDEIDIKGSVKLFNASRQKTPSVSEMIVPVLNLDVVFLIAGNRFSVPVRGRLEAPKWDRDAILKNLVKSYGQNMLRDAIQKTKKGKDVDFRDLLQNAIRTEEQEESQPSTEQSQEDKPQEKEQGKSLEQEVIEGIFRRLQ